MMVVPSAVGRNMSQLYVTFFLWDLLGRIVERQDPDSKCARR